MRRLVNWIAVGCFTVLAALIGLAVAPIRIHVWHRPRIWIEVKDDAVGLFNSAVSNTYAVAGIRLGIIEGITIGYLLYWTVYVADRWQADLRARRATRRSRCGPPRSEIGGSDETQ